MSLLKHDLASHARRPVFADSEPETWNLDPAQVAAKVTPRTKGVIATGEGGMVVKDDDAPAARVRLPRGQGMNPERRYWLHVVGYNYRMMNIPAWLR